MGKECMEQVCEMKEKLVTDLKSYLDAGTSQACTEEVGQIADVIKDLSETEYYCAVTKAMIEADEEAKRYGYSYRVFGDENYDRPGYTSKMPYMHEYEPDIYGYSHSNMRYSGNTRMGYRPYVDQEPYINSYLSEYGKGYDDYKTAKRHYTETHSPEDKEKMNESTAKHVNNAIAGIKEMWQDADSSLRKDIKADLTALLSIM